MDRHQKVAGLPPTSPDYRANLDGMSPDYSWTLPECRWTTTKPRRKVVGPPSDFHCQTPDRHFIIYIYIITNINSLIFKVNDKFV